MKRSRATKVESSSVKHCYEPEFKQTGLPCLSSIDGHCNSPASLQSHIDRFIPPLTDVRLPLKTSPRSLLLARTHFKLSKRFLPYHTRYSINAGPNTDHARLAAQSLYRRMPHSPKASAAKSLIPHPISIHSAEDLVDDYYSHILAWSPNGAISVALRDAVYTKYSELTTLTCQLPPLSGYVSCIYAGLYSPSQLAVGSSSGFASLWDLEVNRRLISSLESPHDRGFVGAMCRTDNILSLGHGGVIWNHDIRRPQTKVQELAGHRKRSRICGLQWQEHGGYLLASGGDDDMVCIWDVRMGSKSILRKAKDFKAGIKALAWCPWQPSVLAAGGGIADPVLRLYLTAGSSLTSLRAVGLHSQITSVHFSVSCKELLTTHGFPRQSSVVPICRGAIKIHKYATLESVRVVEDAHVNRITNSCLSANGDQLLSAGDELVKIWHVWGQPRKETSHAEIWRTIR